MSLVWCHRTSAARSSAISHPTIYDCFVLTPLNVTPTSEASVTSSGQWPLFMQSNAASAPFNCPECPLSSPLTTDHWPITLSTRYWSKPIHWLVYSYLHCRRHHCWRGKGTIIQAVNKSTDSSMKEFLESDRLVDAAESREILARVAHSILRDAKIFIDLDNWDNR